MTNKRQPRINVLLSPFQNAFIAELAHVVVAETQDLGFEARILSEPDQCTPDASDVFVMLPPHEWVRLESDRWLEDDACAARTIGIGAEQPGSPFFDRNAEIGRRLGIFFDFSQRSIDAFHALGLEAEHLPFGYTRHWDRFVPDGNTFGPDIVFIGNFKERRLTALAQIADTLGNHRSHLVLGDNTAPNIASSRWFVAGDDKRSLLASAKVLLNIHQAPEPYFEWLRFTEAALCGTVVLTEPSSHSEPYLAGTHFATSSLGDMGATLDELLANDKWRNQVRLDAYEAVRSNPFATQVERLAHRAAELIDLPVPARLPGRTRRGALIHRGTLAPPQPPTSRTRQHSSISEQATTELFLVGDIEVATPATAAMTVLRFPDAESATAAMSASRATGVGIVTRSGRVTSAGLATLQQLIADGAEAACAMVAEQFDDTATLRGLWQPTGSKFDPTDLANGWFLVRPACVQRDGTILVTELEGSLRHAPLPAFIATTPPAPRVVVVMATFNPRFDLFRRQVQSLREQTFRDFVCIVSDDSSEASHQASIRMELAIDSRFVFVGHEHNVGFYLNFERGLVRASQYGAGYIALSDQDDYWYPDKLERAVAQLNKSGATLVFSDVAPVDGDRRLITTSFYWRRHPTTGGVLDLTMMNSAIGATSVFRSDLLRVAMPFPPPRFRAFHDHWLARCAQLSGGLIFDKQVSMEYVQHDHNIQGFSAGGTSWRALIKVLRSAPSSRDFTDDVARVSGRLNEMRLLEQRIGTSPGLRRAISRHERCLSGGPAVIVAILLTYIRDRYLRWQPRHLGIEIGYLRAAMSTSTSKAAVHDS